MPRTNKPRDGASDQPKSKKSLAKKPNGAANGGIHHMNDGDQVARRAYEIYESRGGQHGSDVDHWLEAEKELKPGPTSVTGSMSAARPKKSRKTPEAGA